MVAVFYITYINPKKSFHLNEMFQKYWGWKTDGFYMMFVASIHGKIWLTLTRYNNAYNLHSMIFLRDFIKVVEMVVWIMHCIKEILMVRVLLFFTSMIRQRFRADSLHPHHHFHWSGCSKGQPLFIVIVLLKMCEVF